MRHSGYRRVTATEQIYYIFLGLIRNWWARITGRRKKSPSTVQVETNVFDKETIYENCTIQVLTNTVTGEVSVGWWRNERGKEPWNT